jgi:uncharacterized protein YhaN
MKIIDLHLAAFGPFTEKTLTFAPGNLHIVFGPNEAGKSSSLRAISNILYGIPARTSDSFVHENKNLRIGATLECSDGRRQRFIRRKGNKDTLLDGDGNPCDDSTIEPFLGKVREDLFLHMFGLSHQRLIQGGRDIVEGKGDVGESIFAAGMGVVGLRRLLEELEGQQAALFKSGGQVPEINRLLAAFNLAKQEVRSLSLSTSDYKKVATELEAARHRCESRKSELKDLHNELARLERLHSAAPKIAALRGLQRELAELGDVRILVEDFPERRKQNQRDRHAAAAALTTLEAELVGLKKSVDAHPVDQRLLDMAGEIPEFFGSRGAFLKNQKDLPTLGHKRHNLQEEAQRLLKRMGLAADLDQTETLRLSDPRKREIGAAAQELKSLRQQVTTATRNVEARKSEVDELKQKIEAMPAVRSIDSLQAALRHAGNDRNLASQLNETNEKRTKIGDEARARFKRLLPAPTVSFDRVEELPVPMVETIQRFLHEETGLKQNEALLAGQLRDLEDRQANLQSKIEAVTKGGSVPTEDELVQQRDHRDRGWKLVRRSWEGETPDENEIEGFAESGSLADGYERLVRVADDTADELRRESARVAQLQQLRSEVSRLDDEVAAKKDRMTALTADREAWRKRWREAWEQTGLKPLFPVEMLAWRNEYVEVVEAFRSLCDLGNSREQMEGRMNHLRERLVAEGEQAGLPPLPPELSFGELLDQVEQELEKIQRHNGERQQAERDLAAVQKQVGKEQAALANLREQHDAAQQSWGGTVAALGLSPASDPDDAFRTVEGLNDIFHKLDEAAGLEARRAGIRKECEVFETGVASLVGRVEGGVIASTPQETITRLNQRLTVAQANFAAITSLQEQIAEKEKQLSAARVRFATLEEALRQLLEQGGVDEESDFQLVEDSSTKVRRLRDSEATLAAQLRDFAGGGTVEELIAASGQVDPETLPGQIQELRAKQNEVSQELAGFQEEVGALRGRLAALDGSEAAALKAEAMEGILAALRTKIEAYARARLGSVLLRREIERYRQEHQGPVLRRAGQFFARLTLGSFTGLATDFGENDQQVLVGTRPDAGRVTVAGMSDGTCDQLYLALRLASLEHHLETNEAMPLILDDILVNFDDERARATLEILAEISAKNQIIYFTHHRHILEIAEPLAFQIHQLPRETESTRRENSTGVAEAIANGNGAIHAGEADPSPIYTTATED